MTIATRGMSNAKSKTEIGIYCNNNLMHELCLAFIVFALLVNDAVVVEVAAVGLFVSVSVVAELAIFVAEVIGTAANYFR